MSSSVKVTQQGENGVYTTVIEILSPTRTAGGKPCEDEAREVYDALASSLTYETMQYLAGMMQHLAGMMQ